MSPPTSTVAMLFPCIAAALAFVTGVHASALPDVMHSISLKWDFEDGLNGWAQAAPMEMGIEVDAINGYLRGVVLNSVAMGSAFVDSPELRVEIDPDDRDFLLFRMKHLGVCDRAMIALERNPLENEVVPGVRQERVLFHDPVLIPFSPRSNALQDDVYTFPIWRHVTGTIHRIRLYPCTRLPSYFDQSLSLSQSGQAFHIDWVAFAKAPRITKVRGCIDKYFEADSSEAVMNCTEDVRHTNSYHAHAAFVCNPTSLPISSTYNCLREGGQRISISGKHFGPSDAIVLVDGAECTDVVHVRPEQELECTLPAVSSAWLQAPVFPSMVRVTNGRLHDLFDEVPYLLYAAPVRFLSTPIVSNVAAHAIDLNWAASPDVWESMTITGYQVEWKRCNAAIYSARDSIIVGNVTSTTIINLESGTQYHARVTALVEDYRLRTKWRDIDLYGRRHALPGGVVGSPSPISLCVSTLSSDFVFPHFSATLLTNVSAATAPVTLATIGPTGEIGDQGHFGLYVNGDANVENCNATSSCCDDFNSAAVDSAAAIASCTLMCSVTETRTGVFVNERVNRTIATNSASAVPVAAKIIQPIAEVDRSILAPITAPCGPALRLTASASFLTGSAWYPRQMNVREGFDTTFEFRISNPSTTCSVMDDVFTRCRSRGGDGFAFVVQNDGDIRLGSGGMELGYGGIHSALAIEFDTWYNPEQVDPYENHVSVLVSRKLGAIQGNHTFSLGSTTSIPDLTDGSHSARIRYDPNVDDAMLFHEAFVASALAGEFLVRGEWASGVGTIAVFIDDLNSPVLVVPLRLEDTVELHHGRAWVGFTASTGAVAFQAHDLLSWKFEALRKEIKYTPP